MLLKKKTLIYIIVIIWLTCTFAATIFTRLNPVNQTKLAPLSAQKWYQLANYYNQKKLNKHKYIANNISAKLAHNRQHLLIPIFKKQIQWRQYRSARDTAINILYTNPSYGYNAFAVLSNIIGTKQFVKKVILKGIRQHHNLNINHILNTIYSGLAKNNQVFTFVKIWQYLPDNIKINYLTQSRIYWYYKRFLKSGGPKFVNKLTASNSNHTLYSGKPITLDYTNQNNKNLFCWMNYFHENTKIKNTKSQLSLVILANRKKTQHRLLCYIPVNIQKQSILKITSEWAASNIPENISTNLQITVFNKYKKAQQLKLTKKGSWTVDSINHTFNIDENTTAIEINVQLPRPKNNTEKQPLFSIKHFNLEST